MSRGEAFAVGLCVGALAAPVSYELAMHLIGRNTLNPTARRK